MKNNTTWINRWNERYKHSEYAYGTEPNVFLKEQLKNYKAGKVLFAVEGEGRNAVFAAEEGWEVTAFDISEEGKKKALRLAENLEVNIDYRVGLLPELKLEENSYDVLVLIFAHFPAEIKSAYHQTLAKLIKIGGIIIFEGFSKSHFPVRKDNPKVGGPDNLEDLFSVSELKHDFQDFTFINIEDKQVRLNEGLYHQGIGSVIQFIAEKK